MSYFSAKDGKRLTLTVEAKGISLRAGTFPAHARIVACQDRPGNVEFQIMDASDPGLVPEPSSRYALPVVLMNGAATVLWDGLEMETCSTSIFLREFDLARRLDREVWIPLHDFEEAIRAAVRFMHA